MGVLRAFRAGVPPDRNLNLEKIEFTPPPPSRFYRFHFRFSNPTRQEKSCIIFCYQVVFSLKLMKVVNNNTVKASVSFSKTVAEWADELAKRKGFEKNFSAYIADLIRRDKECDGIKLAMPIVCPPPRRSTKTERPELNES